MTDKPRKPRVFDADDTRLSVEDVADTWTDVSVGEAVRLIGEENPVATVPASARKRRWTWGKLLFGAAGALISLGIGLAATRLIEDLWARNAWLGQAGLVLLGIALFALLAICVRELLALRRLNHVGTIRIRAERGLRHDEAAACTAALKDVRALYQDRADVSWGMDRLKEHDGHVMDAAERLRIAERELMAGLDEAAARIISTSARRVSVITAVNPAPALDVAFVATQNLSMLRRLSELYGGRPGTLGTLRLGRSVITHLAVTGSLALGDTFIQHFLGKGLAGRLSAKLGEGVVNGIMTARIGIAAIDLCRPLPFTVLEKPSLQSVIGGVFETGDDKK